MVCLQPHSSITPTLFMVVTHSLGTPVIEAFTGSMRRVRSLHWNPRISHYQTAEYSEPVNQQIFVTGSTYGWS